MMRLCDRLYVSGSASFCGLNNCPCPRTCELYQPRRETWEFASMEWWELALYDALENVSVDTRSADDLPR